MQGLQRQLIAYASTAAVVLSACNALKYRAGQNITLKAGGGTAAKIVYSDGDRTEEIERTALPWSKKIAIGLFDDGVALDVRTVWNIEKARSGGSGREEDSGGWCEIWIGDELCDREDRGTWCRCTWQGGWRGTLNGDRWQRTSIWW
jgi:hypothetical protein